MFSWKDPWQKRRARQRHDAAGVGGSGDASGSDSGGPGGGNVGATGGNANGGATSGQQGTDTANAILVEGDEPVEVERRRRSAHMICGSILPRRS